MKDLLKRDWRDALVPVAMRAGDAILEIYEAYEASGDVDVVQKADRSPLTEADLAAERVIQEGLAKAAPDLPVLSEESADAPYDERRDWPALLVVDPLDGTKEFLRRNGEFTVNIALVADGEPVAGVVHAPAIGRTYFGQRGAGAVLVEDGGAEQALATDPIDRDDVTRVVASRSHRDPRTGAFLETLGDHVLVLTGSSLKFCRLAEGAADLYPRFAPTMEWDTAAAQAVLEAAGGAVRDAAELAPLRYNKEELLNPYFIAAADPAWFEAYEPR